MARPCVEDGPSARSWRGKLQWLRSTGGTQGADHRRRFRHGPGSCHRYAREGANVAINYFPNEEEDAQDVVALLKAEGRTAVAIPGDLRDEDFCKRLVTDAVKGLGGLDILVLNAARQQTRASIMDVSSEDFDATMKTNIYAPFWIIKAALSHLKPSSAIIGTSSEQATDPSPELYDYAQTKAATTNCCRSLAKQLAPKGIRVNAVAPGPIWTPLQVSGGANEEKLQQFGSQTPMGRRASLPSSRRSMSSSRHLTRATPPARSTRQPEERACRDLHA
jgi:NAD(P)-dependent dehydrogenase (short-subunit alcohol dehydrogenase family)